MKSFCEIFPRGLIVSCQAREDEPLHGSEIMARLAVSAEMGGAGGIRANSPEDVRAIKSACRLPVIAIYKVHTDYAGLFITPTFETARLLAVAGADAIALDGTSRPRPGGEMLPEIIRRIHDELQLPVMADCSTVEEGVMAAGAGADAVATTLAGYTPYTKKTDGPDWAALEGMIREAGTPVVGEGRFYYPPQAARALEMGAWAIVVGGAITRPHEITRRFVDEMGKKQ